jgi:hypothetical protein
MAQNRQLAAIMFTDIEGYTSIMQENEENALVIKTVTGKFCTMNTKTLTAVSFNIMEMEPLVSSPALSMP